MNVLIQNFWKNETSVKNTKMFWIKVRARTKDGQSWLHDTKRKQLQMPLGTSKKSNGSEQIDNCEGHVRYVYHVMYVCPIPAKSVSPDFNVKHHVLTLNSL